VGAAGAFGTNLAGDDRWTGLGKRKRKENACRQMKGWPSRNLARHSFYLAHHAAVVMHLCRGLRGSAGASL
jgi:hypothetical protein